MRTLVETLWLSGAAVTSAAVIVGRALWHRMRQACTELIPLRIHCPLDSDRYDCTIARDSESGQWLEVRACSAYPKGCLATCGQQCTRLLNWGVPVAVGSSRRKPDARA
jgi:hypothetical protein